MILIYIAKLPLVVLYWFKLSAVKLECPFTMLVSTMNLISSYPIWQVKMISYYEWTGTSFYLFLFLQTISFLSEILIFFLLICRNPLSVIWITFFSKKICFFFVFQLRQCFVVVLPYRSIWSYIYMYI